MNSSIALPDPTKIDRRTAKKGFSRFAPTGARVVMGLLFFLAGLNGLFHFLPQPTADAMPAGAWDLTMAFAKTGYMFPLVGATQLAVGVLLLANRFVPLALILAAPVVVNIVAFHVFLAPQGLPIAIVLLALEVYLAAVHGRAFRSVLVRRF